MRLVTNANLLVYKTLNKSFSLKNRFYPKKRLTEITKDSYRIYLDLDAHLLGSQDDRRAHR